MGDILSNIILTRPFFLDIESSGCKDNYVMEEIGIGTEREKGEEKEKGG